MIHGIIKSHLVLSQKQLIQSLFINSVIAYFALYSTQRTTFDQIYVLNYDALNYCIEMVFNRVASVQRQ